MKKKSLILVSLIAALSLGLGIVLTSCNKITVDDYIKPVFSSANLVEGASVTAETLRIDDKPDGANILKKDGKCWTPRPMEGKVRPGEKNVNSIVLDIELKEKYSFNTAVIREIGNQVQYFRLQYLDDKSGKYIDFYRTEKIRDLRICSFDKVKAKKIRLIIDKFTDNKPAKIDSIELYNEPKRDVENFNVTTYQRIDEHGDIPSVILDKSIEEQKAYARFYDVYNTVIIFGSVNWDENGKMTFGKYNEEGFANEVKALKKLIDMRSNKNHEVKLICTALADGAFGDGHDKVNYYMADHWESVADQMIEFMKKYDFDGLDIDWEYPHTKKEWAVYDKFMNKLHGLMTEYKPDSVLSAAISAGAIGMSQETMNLIDQLQYMAYDGRDEDGLQSTLDQAQRGILEFLDKGAKLSQINIGIASFGRPTNSTFYWPSWRDLDQANYWDCKYYNIECEGQVFDAAYASPALAGDKTTYALLSGIGGVMVFRLGCDKFMDSNISVSNGIYNALYRYINKY